MTVVRLGWDEPAPADLFERTEDAPVAVNTVGPVTKPRMEVNISFRVRRTLRDDAQKVATERQENVSDILREALENYVREHGGQQ